MAPVQRPRSVVRGALVAASLAVGAAACGSTSPRGAPAHPSTTSSPAATSSPSTTMPSAGTSATVPAAVSSWLTYGGSFSRTSLDSADPSLGHQPVAAWTSPRLDGPVYGEPLIYKGQVLVATENNTVYALSASDGTVAWSDHLAPPVPASRLPCGNITPTVGVTSTMVIDPSSGTLFAAAALVSGSAVQHALYGIDLASHRVAWSRHVDQPGWTAAAQLQRIALGLAGGRVIVGFGGNYGDCGTFNGWIVGVPESGSGPLLAYKVPTGREGAVWAPAGVTVDGAGAVFVVTGNGGAGPGQPFDHGNSVIELSPALVERQYFAPSDWAQANAADADLGSTAAMLLDGARLFVVGKQQTAYLLDARSLGGIGGQVASADVCASLGGNAYLAPFAYVVCTDDGTIAQVRVGPDATMARGWTWKSPTGQAGSPTIAGGVLWTVDIGASVLYGVDLSSGATRFTVGLRTGTPPHFAAPSAGDGMLVVAGSTGVEAFR